MEMKMYIGGLDIGTTGCKITVYNEKGEFAADTYREYNASRVNGEHEIDAAGILSAVFDCIEEISTVAKPEVLGVTSFGETFVMLDENDNVLLPSMLYTDPRGAEETDELCRKFGEDKLIEITGTKPNAMYSFPKLMWIKRNKPDIYKKVKRILLMEDYIIYSLTGNAVIDYSLAARTMAFDIRKKCWAKEIFDAFAIDVKLMSEPVKTGNAAGRYKDIVIVNGAHDQVASAVGAGVFEVGQAVDGTGTVECVTPVFDQIPDNKTMYEKGYSVVPYVFDGTYVCYALSFTGGAVLKWFRDNFAEEKGKDAYAVLDRKISDSPTDILVMPHFAGAANPYMDIKSKAAVLGLTLENTCYDFYKALMEGVTYEIMYNIETLGQLGINIGELFATGGGAASDKWLGIKADILGRNITALAAKEAGACGTCMLAAVAAGAYENLYQAKKYFVKERKTVKPDSGRSEIYKKNYEKYKKIYNAVRTIAE